MAMLNGVNSRAMSKGIFTTHYYGPSSPVSIVLDGYKKASVEKVKSPSFAFTNNCNAQTWSELMAHSITLTEVGDYAIYATSGRKDAYLKSDLAKYGLVHNPDESIDRMDGWIGATVGSHAIECVKKPTGNSGLHEGTRFIPDYSKHCPSMTNVNVPISRWSGVNMDINKVGVGFSQIANTDNDLIDLIFTNYIKERPGFNPETEAFLEFLASRGLGPAREIKARGVENLENAIARTYHNGTATLVASKGIYQKALAMAKAYGLEGEEAARFAKRAVWYHELYHVFDHRKGLSERQREIDVGEFLAEFFGNRASIVSEKLARYYRAFAKENKDYAQRWREGRIKSSNAKLRSRIESLAREYASEAKHMGMSEEEAPTICQGATSI